MSCQVCTFRVGNQIFGVPVAQVKEVLPAELLTPVPLSTPVVVGLLNLRGEIVATIDLATRLGLESTDGPMAQGHVVITDGSEILNLVVDEIEEVLDLEDSLREEPPTSLSESTRDLLDSVYKTDEGLLMVLDVWQVMEFASFASVEERIT